MKGKIFTLYVVMTSFIKFFRLKTLEMQHLLQSLLQLKLIQMLKEWQYSTTSLPKSTAMQLHHVKLSRSNHFCLTQSYLFNNDELQIRTIALIFNVDRLNIMYQIISKNYVINKMLSIRLRYFHNFLCLICRCKM